MPDLRVDHWAAMLDALPIALTRPNLVILSDTLKTIDIISSPEPKAHR